MSNRSRTFSWTDPSVYAEEAAAMNGIDYLKSITAEGEHSSPVTAALDFKIERIEKGTVEFSFVPQEFHYNPIGSVHGGVIAALLDSVMGSTLHSLLDAGQTYTTLELKVNFLKAVTLQTGHLKATGKIIHSGRSTALIEAQLTDDEGKIYAHGLSTCMILERR